MRRSLVTNRGLEEGAEVLTTSPVCPVWVGGGWMVMLDVCDGLCLKMSSIMIGDAGGGGEGRMVVASAASVYVPRTGEGGAAVPYVTSPDGSTTAPQGTGRTRRMARSDVLPNAAAHMPACCIGRLRLSSQDHLAQ